MRTSFFMILFFLLSSGICAAAEKDTGIQSYSKLTHIRNSGPVFFTKAAYEGLEELQRGHADKAYTLWLQEGFAGNLDALAMAAMLCAAEEKKPSAGWKIRWQGDAPPPPVCPAPAKFWEDSLISLLGEGEGTFVLGLFGMELMEVDPHRKKSDYMPMIEGYMLRSAVTGHADGMYGAWLTGENRKGAFTPPTERPDILVLPKEYEPKSTYEQRYWETHAAHAGNWWAMTGMGWAFLAPPPHVQPNPQAGADYFTMAASTGSARSARVLRSLYAEGERLRQDCKKSIYFGALGAQLVGIGSFASDNATQEELEEDLQNWNTIFQRGELRVDGKQVLTAPCLTQAEFDAAVADSVPAFERAKVMIQEAQRQHDALYNAARARLPEIKAAYEKTVQNRSTAVHKGQ